MWVRATAGLIPGFLLAAAITGLICWALPGPWHAALLPATIAFVPLWVGIFCASFAFRKSRSAWLWMLPLAMGALALLRGLQSAGWIE